MVKFDKSSVNYVLKMGGTERHRMKGTALGHFTTVDILHFPVVEITNFLQIRVLNIENPWIKNSNLEKNCLNIIFTPWSPFVGAFQPHPSFKIRIFPYFQLSDVRNWLLDPGLNHTKGYIQMINIIPKFNTIEK